MFSFLLKPRPYPAFVLLAIIGIFFGFVCRGLPIVATGWFVAAAVLIVTFVRGLVIDLSIQNVGLVADGRVTSIERSDEVCLHFTFQDASGTAHDATMVLAPEEATKIAVGSSVRVRYHPRCPDMWRWLG